jgi:hypothetical protein
MASGDGGGFSTAWNNSVRTRSPNLADAVMICFAPGSQALRLRAWELL